MLDRAHRDLDEAAARDARIAEARDDLAEAVDTLATAVRPRAEYALVHGELGPDHVILDERGEPVLIDIEGLMYFDVEWEHAFVRLRFGDHYSSLHVPDLDQHRLTFYTLALRLSLVADPLRLIEGDLSDRDLMRGIAEHNAREALTSVSLRT